MQVAERRSGLKRTAEDDSIPAKYLHGCNATTRRKGTDGCGKRFRAATSQPCAITPGMRRPGRTEASAPGRRARSDVPAMYYYALECDDPCLRKRWLKRAAEAGYGPAFRQHGLECDDQNDRRRWLSQAVFDGYAPATELPSLQAVVLMKAR